MANEEMALHSVPASPSSSLAHPRGRRNLGRSRPRRGLDTTPVAHHQEREVA
jgi:hypothetical protein